MSEQTEMELVVNAAGNVRCIYDEELDLRKLGKLQITRASHVEPDAEGYWWADMGPVDGPVLGPYSSRSAALAAERVWLGLANAMPATTGLSQENYALNHFVFGGSASPLCSMASPPVVALPNRGQPAGLVSNP
jgi:hypothetical protein